ncbi:MULTISPECIES: helix-turn-helix domain-containing protein [Gammaproteobacteria]|uniref:helix-turn-helix domain-containing protein n=1 Tax=Gammaproteobacteria TaxID=1236 RepID=UPI000DCFD79D|nr:MULTISPECIES: helix-turn-helix domain-containing protein [Gammaproteobacteria]RTE86574.1 helix-turn-helix domain-containing protein [Aliidiomarina sp. B3213]TCZ90871.1 helix-turn-helix domain-containing protein [Lysobacter sp. N42]
MKITDSKALSNYLRNERRARGLSQAAVGDVVGLRQGTVSKFESMPDKTQLDTLFRLLSALELELSVKPKNTTSHTETSAGERWNEEW